MRVVMNETQKISFRN